MLRVIKILKRRIAKYVPVRATSDLLLLDCLRLALQMLTVLTHQIM